MVVLFYGLENILKEFFNFKFYEKVEIFRMEI